ncbi:thiamine-binding protein [Stackebrandtia soli]|uniref:thiamine-binding protein n=1 Tax=Stackebrandtia soli TaxID=1892856 RepID=UPI0039E8B241
MTAMVAFSVTPLGLDEHVGRVVAEAVRVVRESGLANHTDAMYTIVEGDSLTEVMAVVERAIAAVAEHAPRVSAVVKVDYFPGRTDGMTAKVASIERHLGA